MMSSLVVFLGGEAMAIVASLGGKASCLLHASERKTARLVRFTCDIFSPDSLKFGAHGCEF